jgi:hypothetical protein
MTVSPFLNFTQALSIGSGDGVVSNDRLWQGTAPPAGFEPARYGLEGRCSIRTELQGLFTHECALRRYPGSPDTDDGPAQEIEG